MNYANPTPIEEAIRAHHDGVNSMVHDAVYDVFQEGDGHHVGSIASAVVGAVVEPLYEALKDTREALEASHVTTSDDGLFLWYSNGDFRCQNTGSAPARDTAHMFHILTQGKKYNSILADNVNEFQWADSILAQFAERGYDVTTLRISIERK